MTKLLGRLPRIWGLVKSPIVIVFSLATLTLYGIYLLTFDRIAGDAASHLLLAISPLLKIGAPYKDFWEIKPPVWPMVLYVWSSFFGFKIMSIRLINLIVAGLVIMVCKLIYKKVFSTPVYEVVFVFTIVITLSPVLYTYMFLPTELLGLLFSMLALASLIFIKNDFRKFYFSGLLFLAASQTKEPFTLTVLAILPVLLVALLRGGFLRLMKNISEFVLGIVSGILVIYLYLQRFGSLNSYSEIFQYKQKFFPFTYDRLVRNLMPGFEAAERTFTEFPLGFLYVGILSFLAFLLANKFSKSLIFNSRLQRLESKSHVVLDKHNLNKYIVLFYSIGSFLGFGLGGVFGQHYLIQIVFPFYILYGLFISYTFKAVVSLSGKPKIYLIASVVLFIISIFISFPKRQYFLSYLPYVTPDRNISIEDNIAGFENRLTQLTKDGECILSVYGWGASENYLYSGRRPCTRFFLANMVREGWQNNEYAQDIINNPPAAIHYRTSGADMDIGKFESEVINIKNIVSFCYLKDVIEKDIYTPKFSDTNELKNCVKNNSR